VAPRAARGQSVAFFLRWCNRKVDSSISADCRNELRCYVS
jgi:hypothetical protein